MAVDYAVVPPGNQVVIISDGAENPGFPQQWTFDWCNLFNPQINPFLTGPSGEL